MAQAKVATATKKLFEFSWGKFEPSQSNQALNSGTDTDQKDNTSNPWAAAMNPPPKSSQFTFNNDQPFGGNTENKKQSGLLFALTANSLKYETTNKQQKIKQQ